MSDELFRLPSLNIIPDNIIVAGHSSGSLMSAQLIIAYPEVFQGVGLLNGGLPGFGPRFEKEYQPMIGIQDQDELNSAKEAAWAKTKDFLTTLASENKIGN